MSPNRFYGQIISRLQDRPLVKCTVTGSTVSAVVIFRIIYIREMTNNTSGYRLADMSKEHNVLYNSEQVGY